MCSEGRCNIFYLVFAAAYDLCGKESMVYESTCVMLWLICGTSEAILFLRFLFFISQNHRCQFGLRFGGPMWDFSCRLDRSIHIQSRQSTLHGGSVAISFERVIQYIHETLQTNNGIRFGSVVWRGAVARSAARPNSPWKLFPHC